MESAARAKAELAEDDRRKHGSDRASTGPAGGSKIAAIIVMLRRPKGARIADLCKATGWQPHLVRAAISATIKKKLGLKVMSEITGSVRAYRVIA